MKKSLMMVSGLLLSAFSATAYTTTPSETLKVWFDNMTVDYKSDNVFYLTVYESDDIDYSAFNMTFYIPAGLRVNQVKQGREMVDDIFLSERAAATHSIACNILPSGTELKVISTSTKNDNLYNDDEDGNPLDKLYTIGLVADDTLQPGDYTIEMTGIKFVINTGDACVPADDHVYGTLTVKDVNTEIEKISADRLAGECYDLNGLPINGVPEAGTIVIYKGKKVIVKK